MSREPDPDWNEVEELVQQLVFGQRALTAVETVHCGDPVALDQTRWWVLQYMRQDIGRLERLMRPAPEPYDG